MITTMPARVTAGVKCRGRRVDGEPCGKWAIAGATVCYKHGGGAKQVRSKAIVRADLLQWGLNDTTEDPGEVLLRLVTQASRRAALYADLLERQYQAAAHSSTADMADLPIGVAALIGFKYSSDNTGKLYEVEEAIRGLVQLEAQERDRCAKFAKTALDAGIAERQVRLAERQGELIAAVLRAVLSDPELGLTEQQMKAVPHVALRHLAIAG